jgi:CRISPR-associated protein Csc2
MSFDEIKTKLSKGIIEKHVNEPSAHYVHILLLRELQSSAIFTTNGQDADITTVGISADDGMVEYSPVMMFKRKQTGSDRRKGKELQRNFIEIKDTMSVNEMTPDSPESVLYGSAAAGKNPISVTSRVMYDTAYSIRDSSAIVEEKFQNAPGDEYAKGPSTAIREPDFIMPGTLFPCVITLRDATFDELIFVLGLTKMNKRYGAVTSRIGRMENHILGIYFGTEEGTANLILSQEVARRIAKKEGKLMAENLSKFLYSTVLDIEKVKIHIKQAYDEDIAKMNIKALDNLDTTKLLDLITAETIKQSLDKLKTASAEFIKEVKSKKPAGK